MPPVSFYDLVFSGNFDPTPPATSAALSPLAKSFVDAYKQPRRIGAKIVTLAVAPAA